MNLVSCQTRFFMSMMQCESFVMIILGGEVFAIDVLFRVSLLKSIVDALTIILDGFGSNLAKLNKIEHTCDNNSDSTMVVKTLLQDRDVGVEMQFLWIIIDNIVQIVDELLPIILISMEFGVFVHEICLSVFSLIDYSKTLVILDSKRTICWICC